MTDERRLREIIKIAAAAVVLPALARRATGAEFTPNHVVGVAFEYGHVFAEAISDEVIADLLKAAE